MGDGTSKKGCHRAVTIVARLSLNPTQKSLKLLRARGGLVEKVEHWNSFAGCRQDLFGFGDIVHVAANEITLVQTTSAAHVGARLKKIAASAAADLWLVSPHRSIEIHGWKKGSMTPRIVRLPGGALGGGRNLNEANSK